MKSSPVRFIAIALIAAALAARAADKPNVVFILADDLGVMDIGAFNPKTFYETPNIDGLAKSGMKFTQAYAACHVCSPTRASIMSGKYPARTGVTDFIGGTRRGKMLPAPNANHLALEEVTIAERLRDEGYATFFCGKWHLGGAGFLPENQGFGVAPASPMNRPGDPKATDLIADEAVKFIEANKAKPFFAYLPFNAVHIPVGAKQELIEKYRMKKSSAPEDAWGQERDHQVRLVQNRPDYAAMLEQFDTAVGRVLAALDRNGLAEKTIVIFMSDNGGLSTAEGHPTSNLPLRAGKGWYYEGGIREPLIVRAPGIAKHGSVCDSTVISTDFYPTLLELCGLKPAPEQHRDGVSFASLLKGGTQERGPLFWHYPHYSNQGGAPAGALRDGDWKLIEWYEDNSRELYNVRADIGETNNLAEQNPEKVKALTDKLAAWRTSVGAKMPVPNPNYKGHTEVDEKPAKKK